MVWKKILYEKLEDGILKITMNRPEVRNALTEEMCLELDKAITEAARDNDVRVIIVSGAGIDFCAGHDIGSPEGKAEWQSKPETYQKADRLMKLEEEIYTNPCMRLHDIPKPTIAQVQGHAIIGGMMTAAACDIIIAADNAKFADVALISGWAASGEYFNHPWDFGFRKAKEMLFTGDAIDANEAYRLGFVNHVVPLEKLEEKTMQVARKISLQDPFLLKLAKLSVNEAMDLQGFRQAQSMMFYLHMLAHSHYMNQGLVCETLQTDAPVKDFIRERAKRFGKI